MLSLNLLVSVCLIPKLEPMRQFKNMVCKCEEKLWFNEVKWGLVIHWSSRVKFNLQLGGSMVLLLYCWVNECSSFML